MNGFIEFKKYYGENYRNLLEAFMMTGGCYVLHAEGAVVLAYRCFKDNPLHIDPTGTDLFIQFCGGRNWENLLNIIEPDHLVFHRHGKLKIYEYEKLLKKLGK